MTIDRNDKVLLLANTDWYLYNFRLPLANALRERGYEVVLVSPPGEYTCLLQQAGFRWLPLTMNRGSVNPISQVKSIAALVRLYRREKPDLVHHFTIKCVLYGSLAARLTGNPACINAVAGLGFIFSSSSSKALLLRPLIKVLLRILSSGSSSRLIVQNSEDRDRFIASGLVSQKYIRLIRGSGVNTQRFHPSNRNETRDNYRVLLATRLLWDKGVAEYVEAARILLRDNIDVEFLIAGSSDTGNPGAIPQEQIQQWQDEGVVNVLGHIERMEELLANIDVVVLPTTYGEGVPRILLETAATGLPIVASDTAGCREIVDHQSNGILVAPGDAVELARAIKNLLQTKEERLRMGNAGRVKVLKEFDEQKVIAETLSVYSELLSIYGTNSVAAIPD
ncbi:MAG: glycosyltransferase family 4 protein [Gammaproteobacteria bacterium]|nr:glycosyltransferase family 4 protein [Gammaproteobacteria bacterium]